ncbi:hypothetical protein [Flavisphingomonas formosensis]|uniref:hypothetical protein n=1 Tax=Flavisphingomonas formosensis TaxID=861534 RepID=UPI0012F9A12E|nr:hypothetical protein [Sphingomonas formosensis]
MDHRSVGAYGLIALILIIIAAVVKWMRYHGAAESARRRLRQENREYADGKIRSVQTTGQTDEASDLP